MKIKLITAVFAFTSCIILTFAFCLAFLLPSLLGEGLGVRCSAQGTWTQKADFAGTPRYAAAGFSIGTKGYIGTGADGVVRKDFWEWDKSSNIWTQKADFGGAARYGAVGFSIGVKGYIGTGMDASSTRKKDFWEYDTTLNSWAQKTDFAGTARQGAVGFSIGTKGYIGTGQESVSVYKQDFWEWDGDIASPTYNTWILKTNFGGTVRSLAVGFSIGNKGYIGTGTDAAGNAKQDFWEWDGDTASPTYNTWIQKTNFGGAPRYGAIGFSIANKAYVGVGRDGALVYQQDFWEWDGDIASPTYNTWTQTVNFGGTARNVAVGFSLGNRAYVGTGYDGSYRRDFWEWNTVPLASASGTNPLCFGQCNGTAAASASGGSPPYTYMWSNSQTTQTATGLCVGTFTITVTDADNDMATATVTLTQPAALTATATATAASCFGGSDGIATVTAAGGSGSYTYLWSNGSTLSQAGNLTSQAYSVTVTDANGCTKTQTVIITQPNPLIITTASSATVCAGNCTTLTASATGGNGGYAYLWQPGNLTTAAVTLCPSATTGYTVTATDIANCMDTTFATVTVNPLPGVFLTLNPDTVCINAAPFALAGGSPNGGIYSGAGVSGGNFYPAVAGTGTHAINYSYSDANGCTDTAAAQIVVDACTGINQLAVDNGQLTIYPNPNNGIFTVKMYDLQSTIYNLEIYTVLGEKVYSDQIVHRISYLVHSDLLSGIYFYQITSPSPKGEGRGEVIATGKLIIQQ